MSKIASNIMIGIYLLAAAIALSGGIGLINLGVSLSWQLDMFEWEHDMESLEKEIKEEFDRKKIFTTSYIITGLILTFLGLFLVFQLYKIIIPSLN